MLHLLQMGPSKVLTTFLLQIQNSWQLSLLELAPCCVPTCNTVTPSSDSSDMYTFTVQSGPFSANAALPPHPCLQTSYPPPTQVVSSPSAPSPPSLAFGCPSMPPASSLRVLQWNAGGLQARSTKLLYFLSSHSVDFICIQEPNLNSSSYFWIPGFSALHSDCTLFQDAMHASCSTIIFVRQSLSFSELFPSLFSLDPYSDYGGANISLNNSSSLSFLNVYAPLFTLL